MRNVLINPNHIGGARNDDAKIRQMMAQIAELKRRVEALEAKRGPGRPRNDETSSRPAA
jgi:hypothetical protein